MGWVVGGELESQTSAWAAAVGLALWALSGLHDHRYRSAQAAGGTGERMGVCMRGCGEERGVLSYERELPG